MKILASEIRKEVAKKEMFFNEYLEVEEDASVGKVYLDYSYKMDNTHREPDDRFRILLYPENARGKLIFYADSLYLYTHLESIAKQFKEYCIALEGAEETEEEYRKIWEEVVGMHTGPDLKQVEF